MIAKLRQKTSSILALPFRVIHTRVWLAMGLSLSVFSLILLAEAFEVIPNKNRTRMAARQLQAETLTITGNELYKSTGNFLGYRKALELALERSEELRSIGLRSESGSLFIDLADHKEKWSLPANGESNDRFMFVPLYEGNNKIGTLELSYEPLVSVESWFKSDVARLAWFMLLGTFIFFNIFLWKALKQLDPGGAVPKQVREALGILAEGLLILDRNDTIMLANEMFGTLVGEDSESLEGRNASEFPWQVDVMPWHRALEEGKSVTDNSVRITSAKGLTRVFNVGASPVLSANGFCRGVMVTFDDITVLEENKQQLIKARKEADAANEAKSVFLSRMSHEIRTPMNAIIGYTDILRQGDTGQQEQQKYLGTIHNSGEHLLALINDILDLSKIEAGQMTIENRRCSLVPIAAQVIETLKIRAEQTNLRLELKFDGKIPEQVTTDETRLRQVLINTVGNAIKFTKQGGVVLFVRTTDDGMLQFDVADTGVGISEEAIDKIFKPFSQADDSVTRKFGGTGLGLSISKQLSESMGGGISVKSELNVGTVFTINIDPGDLSDANWIDADQALKIAGQSQKAQGSESRKFAAGHLLVVDDSKANRDLAGLMLKRLGLTCDYAENGQEAIDMIAANPYDVVLMDMNMPVMDGLTATQNLRARGDLLPVIALTAMAIDEEKQRCMDAGCTGFLPKPVRLNALVDTLKNFLDLGELPPDQPQAESATITEATPKIAATPATSSTTVQLNELPTIPHSPSEVDDIEQNLNDTLAELGISDLDLEPKNIGSTPASNELSLPSIVQSSLPLDDPDLRSIYDEFVGRLAKRVGEFQVAWDTGNRNELTSLSHWLAGAAATVGLDALVGPCRELEYSDWSDPQRNEKLVEHIQDLVARVEGIAATA